MDEVIADTWGLGYVDVAEFNEITAQYVSGYVVKKLTDLTDDRLYGRVPEFARMSRRPGIGATAMATIGKTLLDSKFGREVLESSGDVPKVLKLGKRSIPLGRYMLEKLRYAIGLNSDQIREVKSLATYQKSVEMSDLLSSALSTSENPSQTISDFQRLQLEDMEQRIRQVETRAKLYNSKRMKL